MPVIDHSLFVRAESEVTVKGLHVIYRFDGESAIISNPLVSGAVLLALSNPSDSLLVEYVPSSPRRPKAPRLKITLFHALFIFLSPQCALR